VVTANSVKLSFDIPGGGVAVGDGIEVGEGDCVSVGAVVAEDFTSKVLAEVELLIGMGVFGWEACVTAAGEAQPAMRRVIKPSNR